MSESNNNQTTGSQGNQGQQGNVAGVNQGVQNTYNVSVGETAQQRQIDRNICRKMLQQQIQLTSNTVLGRVYGNRNLIDEDLFVDLALVKPKRSQTEKHSQEIDPEKGSDLFTRQEETIEKRFAYQEFLQEVISNRSEKQLAIIGEPGAGKTTLLQKLAFWLLQETDDLVIWVDLAELGNQPLGEYLEQKWLKEALGLSREEIKADWEHKFKGGAVWLLLDGLDEMSQSDLQALNFRGWVMNAPIIVTCRLNLWQANPRQLQGFQTYLTQPFQDEQVQEFIRRWFPVEAEAESLWSQLQESGKERIKDLCRNPLRLTLLCATWKLEDALPETTAELYAGFVESMYAWKETAFAVTEEDKERLNAALGVLAKASLEAETGRFRLTHRLVCEHLGKLKAQGSLFPLALRLGWLNEVGVAAENPRQKVYGFYHATFQEYFAALAVEDWDYFLPKDHVDCPVAGKRYRIFEPQWKQVILLWLGREDVPGEDKEAFIEKLVNFEDECQGLYTYQAYFLAAAGISEFKSYSLAAGVIRQVFQWSFGRFDERSQNWVIDVEFIQQNAWQSLYESDWKLVIQAVADRLEHPKYYEPERRFVIEILEEIGQGDSQAIAILLDYLQVTDDVEYGASVAAFTLSFIGQGSPYAIASFRKALENTDKKDVKKWGNYCLQQIEEDPSVALEHLLDLLRQERDDFGNSLHRWIDLVAAFTLDHLEQENSFKLVPQILQALPLAQKSPFISWRLTKSLGYLGRNNFDVTLKLIEIFKNTNDEVIRRCAVASLEEVGLGNEDVITNLSEKLPEIKDKDTYSQIFETLTKIMPEEPEIIPGFLRLVLDAEESPSRDQWMDVLENMILRVNKLTEMEIITTLFDIIENAKNDSLRWQAANYLADLGQNRFDVIERLLRLLQPGVDKNLHLLEAIVFCLEQIISTNRQSSEVITTLSSFYRDKTHQNNSNLLQAYHKLLWNISRRFFYTDFHQAWHHPPSRSHRPNPP